MGDSGVVSGPNSDSAVQARGTCKSLGQLLVSEGGGTSHHTLSFGVSLFDYSRSWYAIQGG